MTGRIGRKIIRVAKLQDYAGDESALLPLVKEVAGKGYKAVGLAAHSDKDLSVVKALCEEAVSFGLSVSISAYGCMKYREKHLSEHPDHKLVSAGDFKDHDGLSTSSWGCPFNPGFIKGYLDLLRELAAFPGVIILLVNDEAWIPGGSCHCKACRNEYRRDFGGDMPVVADPSQEIWADAKWRNLIKWNMTRWNDVHGRMASVVHEVNDEIKVMFQSSPHCDLWRNPWFHGVDLAAMVEQLDGLSADPYHTAHKPPFFTPHETYVSEWCRFLHGIAGGGKTPAVVTQGFSHPTFSRPLGAADGRWMAIVPPACGIDTTTSYSYTLQRISPDQQRAYEDSFRLDKYFEKSVPLKYAALVHGVKTETFRRPLPVQTPLSYDGTRVLPLAQALRHGGLGYGYLPDRALNRKEAMAEYKVVILPEINCMSEAEEDGLRDFAADKGKLIVLGSLGTNDETGGAERKHDLLEEICGIKILEESGKQLELRMQEKFSFVPENESRDETHKPILTLSHCVKAAVPEGGRVLSEFLDDERSPAIVLTGKDENILWLAGFPTHNSVNRKYGTIVLNQAHDLFPRLVEWHAGIKPALRVEGWPPEVPIKALRPVDKRNMSTFEFFPLAGEDIYIGVVVSYFNEPASFPMVADIPSGKKLEEVRDLLSDASMSFELSGNAATIEVEMGYGDAAKVFLFRLTK